MEFLSGNLPLILCGLAGFGLLLAEAFMPGFGVAGISGIILEVIAIYSAWLHHGTVFALAVTGILLVLTAGTVWLSYRSIMKGRLSRSRLILQDAENAAPEAAKESLLAWKGREGVTVSALRPGGTVEIDGVRLNAASGGDLIPRGARVRVTGAEGDHITVEPV